MKNKIRNQSGRSRIQRTNQNAQKIKSIRKLCEEIVWAFEMPANQGELDGDEIFILIDDISPWQSEISSNKNFGEDDDKYERVLEAMKVSFGFGYALGQMLDLPDIDIKPIQEFLREKKSLLYLPHKKKAT